jgi:hypothetical protein
MFRVSQHPLSRALKIVTATSGIGHNTGTATSFQRGLIRTQDSGLRTCKQIGIPIRKLDIRIELDCSCNVGLKMAIKAETCSL